MATRHFLTPVDRYEPEQSVERDTLHHRGLRCMKRRGENKQCDIQCRVGAAAGRASETPARRRQP